MANRLNAFIAAPRHRVAGMLFCMVAINYLDRSNLSVAATDLTRDLRLDPVRLGLVFSAFGWAYSFCQLPGGWLVDRIDARVLFTGACALWSLATLLQGLAGGFLVLFALRLALGLFESPTFPLCNRIVTFWFPESERAGAVGFYTAGEFVGLAFLTPVLLFIQHHGSWRATFLATGAAGLVWAGLWWRFYRDPPVRRLPVRGMRLADLRLVLSRRKLWGIYLGQFGLCAIPWFFLTWFPTYLIQYRHFGFIATGFYSGLPFLAAFVGVIAGGLASDRLVRGGASPTFARKAPIVAGMLLSTVVLGANYVSQPSWAIFFLTLAFFGSGFASISWVLVSLIAPPRLVGIVGGVFNGCGNLASALVPLAIGFIVKRSGFAAALALVAALALGGALSYIFLVGKVERIEMEADGPGRPK